MPARKSYTNTLQVIESLEDCIADHKQLIKRTKRINQKIFAEENSDHFALSGIFARSLNQKLQDLISEKYEGKITEAEFKRYMNIFTKLLSGDVMMFAPELEVERIKNELTKIEGPQ